MRQMIYFNVVPPITYQKKYFFQTLNFEADHNANVYLNNPILTELEELQQRLLHPTPDLDIYTQNGVLVGFKLFS